MCGWLQVHMTFNSATASAAANAGGLPSFIVMELGESLYSWSDRAQPSLFHTVAVCPVTHFQLFSPCLTTY